MDVLISYVYHYNYVTTDYHFTIYLYNISCSRLVT